MPNSAYNFVPLSENVFFPEWSDKVSMDVPFEDGISGELNIELTADTDIYTRESYPRTENQNNNDQTDFFKITPNGEYAIPGTSIKGAIRNVLEIASFSKIKADDKKYSVRDLSNPDPNLYTAHLTETVGIKTYKPKVQAGWLIEDENGNHHIIPCDYARIEQDEINNHFNLQIGFSKENAKQKYISLINSGGNLQQNFSIGDLVNNPHHGGINLVYRKAHFSNQQDSIPGVLVLTGQAAKRTNNPNSESHPKHLEFVFYNANENLTFEVEQSLYKDFCFIHSDPKDPSKPNEEWDYWKEKMHNGERVPVFYLRERQLKSFGLAMMYKLAYNYSIKEAIDHTSENHNDKKKKDFAETLFGYIKEKDALRGRVSFSTMRLVNHPTEERQIIETVLGSPKPTFYPYYILQNSQRRYNTFMDSNCKINGWKRYPFKDTADAGDANEDQQNVATKFQPLPRGSRFQGKIHLHNVKPSELGGLIWALRFGNNTGCHHSVGMAKPYGYGAATIRINGGMLFFNQTLEEREALPELLNQLELSFIKMMEIESKCECWSTSEQILNLLAMAQTYNGVIDQVYPKLEPRNNEFVNIKRNPALSLQRHITNQVRQTLITRADNILAPIMNEIEQGKREREAKEQVIKEREKKELELRKQQEEEEQKRQQELAAKAEEARKAALSPEDRMKEEIEPLYKQFNTIKEKTKNKYSANDTTFSNICNQIIEKSIKCEYCKTILNEMKTYINKKSDKKFIKIKNRLAELFS